MVDGEYSKESFDYAFNRIYKDLIDGVEPNQNPQAFILGGQPGAGKTGLQTIMLSQCNNNLIIINADEFRELHPDFEHLQQKYGRDSVEYTGRFSGKMTETLIEKLRSEKYNVLVEGTLRTSTVPLNTCNNFKDYGYTVSLGIMAVKPKISYLSTIMRYESMIAVGKTPRATSQSAHDNVVAAIPYNLNVLYKSRKFDNIVIYNREGECLYDMSREKDQNPGNVILEMFNGKWSQHELEQFCKIGMITRELMEKRNAPELADYDSKYYNADIVSNIAAENNLRLPEMINPLQNKQEQKSRSVSKPSKDSYKRLRESFNAGRKKNEAEKPMPKRNKGKDDHDL